MGLDRKDLRDAVKASIDAAVTAGRMTAVVCYNHLAKKFGGMSPIITIEIGPTPLNQTPVEPGWLGLTITLWVKRDDAEAAEDILDDLTDQFLDVLDREYNVRWTRPTQPSYEMVEGNIYRCETHEVEFEWVEEA